MRFTLPLKARHRPSDRLAVVSLHRPERSLLGALAVLHASGPGRRQASASPAESGPALRHACPGRPGRVEQAGHPGSCRAEPVARRAAHGPPRPAGRARLATSSAARERLHQIQERQLSAAEQRVQLAAAEANLARGTQAAADQRTTLVTDTVTVVLRAGRPRCSVGMMSLLQSVSPADPHPSPGTPTTTSSSPPRTKLSSTGSRPPRCCSSPCRRGPARQGA